MGNISVNRKLELMRQIRSRYQRDRYDMFHREQIVYGRTSRPADASRTYETDALEDTDIAVHSFPLRLLFAVGLFLVLVICDRTDSDFVGIPMETCFQAIATDYESSIAAWVDAASDKVQTGTEPIQNNPPAGVRP